MEQHNRSRLKNSGSIEFSIKEELPVLGIASKQIRFKSCKEVNFDNGQDIKNNEHGHSGNNGTDSILDEGREEESEGNYDAHREDCEEISG